MAYRFFLEAVCRMYILFCDSFARNRCHILFIIFLQRELSFCRQIHNNIIRERIYEKEIIRDIVDDAVYFLQNLRQCDSPIQIYCPSEMAAPQRKYK